MRVFLSLFLMMVIGGCAKQSTTSSNSSAESYKKLAYESLEVEAVQFFENSQHDYVLATYNKKANNVNDMANALSYVIINIAEEKVVKKGVLPHGKIRWVSNYEVEIFSPPGIPQDHSQTADGYKSIFNVQTSKITNNKGASN